MNSTDPIADMLTRVRNALKARHQKVDVPASNLKMEIARILKEEGYIVNFKLVEEGVVPEHSHLFEVHSRERARDCGDSARVPPRLPRVCRQRRDSARAWRTGS